MLIKKLKTAAVVLLALSGTAFAYDLKTVELVPVKFQKAPAHAPVKLVENGKIKFAIVTDLNAENRMKGKNKTHKSIAPAIQTLQEAFQQCTGMRPPVIDVKNADKVKYMIVVGDNAITRANGINVDKLPDQGFAVKSFAKGIIIAGKDSSLVEGYNMKPLEKIGSSLGTKYGAYDFVERFLGVRYFYPGEYGTLWPKVKNLEVAPVFYIDAPYMNTRGGQFYLGSTIQSERGRKFWSQYLGNLGKQDFRFYEKWRMGGTLPPGGTHCPRPERMAKAYPDKLETIFYKSPAGNFWYNPKAHVGNCFDVVNLEFADLLLASAKKYYASNGKIDEGGYSDQGCNLTYFSFGVCDTLLPDTEVENHPIVKKLNLMDKRKGQIGSGNRARSRGMANVYARFHQYLANKMKKELPGIKLFIMAYYNVQYAGDDPRYTLPDNTEVFLCLGDLPNKIRSKKALNKMMPVVKEWYESIGNRPIQGLWLYSGRNPFILAVNGEFVGDIPKTFGKYFGTKTMFYDHCVVSCPGNAWFYYYSNYAAYRSMWNPYWDASAAIDAHWEKFYGPKTGKILRQFHQLLRDCYAKYEMENEGPGQLNVIYPLPELMKMEKLLDAAKKSVKPGSIEEKRLKLFLAPWPEAISSLKNQLAYERPVHSVYQLLRKEKVTLDGKGNEKFWAKVKTMKLMDPYGSGTPLKYPATVKLAWDKTGIYGLFESKYPTTADEAKEVFANDNYEVILSPGQGKEVVYQFVFDPLKQKFFGTQRLLPIPQPFDHHWKVSGFKMESRYGKDFWTAEFYIPFSVFKFKPEEQPKVYDTWHCNIVRNKKGDNKEYSGTAMTLGNNHNLNMFGLIKFAGKGE